MTTDEKYMARCLQLARLGESYVSPNPMVGAVIVYNDRIIGEGFHHRFGEAHAEPNAIETVKDARLLPLSTLYVNLEPCSHYGKTPPCADLIVSKKMKRVVIGCFDPNPKVLGKGVKMMQDAGIEVTAGVLENESRQLNRRFICYQEKKRPYIILKWAQTNDGFMDTYRKNAATPALKISNAATQMLTHKMRSENMGIMVSTNTVMLDNPLLTLRHWSGKQPVRIAVDRKGVIPENFNIKDGNVPAIIFTSETSAARKNVEYIEIDANIDNIPAILEKLYTKNIHSVLVEGGAKFLNSFIESGQWDEANIEISTTYIHEGVKAPTLKNGLEESKKIVDGHQWIHYRNLNI